MRKLAGRSARGHAQHRESSAPPAAPPAASIVVGSRLPRRAVAAAVVACGLGGPLAAAPLPPALEQLAGLRDQMARDFGAVIARCVERHDTPHPAFHGCIDWHSAVHGVWALTAYTRATGDERFRALIAATLREDLVAAERKYLRDHPGFEMPYGRAWFLRLAIEYRRAFDSPLLVATADEVARSLLAFYELRRADPLARAYGNPAWALINLLDYARERQDRALADAALAIVRRDFVAAEAPCPADADRGEFMGVCTNWAWLISRALEPDAFRSRLARQFAGLATLRPLEQPRSVHEAGLNFSRAWGLWEIYAATDDPAYAGRFAEHVLATYARRSDWAGDYDTVAHWVAQFGMFAIAPLYPGRTSRGCVPLLSPESCAQR